MTQEEGIVVPGEDLGGSSLTPLEDQARKGGWKPQEEFHGNPDEWVSAKEFVGRQKLYDRIKALDNKLVYQQSKFEKDMVQISDHIAKISKVEYDKAMRQLKAQKEIALEEGNVRALDAINDEIRDTEKAHEASKAAPKPADNSAQIAQEFQEWQNKNDWFQKDTGLRKEAEAIGIGYAASNPGITHAQVLEYVETKIKQYYPDKFQTRKPVVEQTVEAGGITPQSGTGSKKGKGLNENDLSEQEKIVMTTLIKRGALKELAAKNKVSEKQQYLNDLAAAKGLK